MKKIGVFLFTLIFLFQSAFGSLRFSDFTDAREKTHEYHARLLGDNLGETGIPLASLYLILGLSVVNFVNVSFWLYAGVGAGGDPCHPYNFATNGVNWASLLAIIILDSYALHSGGADRTALLFLSGFLMFDAYLGLLAATTLWKEGSSIRSRNRGGRCLPAEAVDAKYAMETPERALPDTENPGRVRHFLPDPRLGQISSLSLVS